MTKFILIGGYPHKAKDGGKAMCQEAVAGFGSPVKVLVCIFARPVDVWQKVFGDTVDFFNRNLPNQKLVFVKASKKDFIKEIKNTDILFFLGGDTGFLTTTLNKIDNWQWAIKGKTVLGSSAGCDILAKYDYDLEKFECSEGFGLVPVKTFVHYESEEYTPPIGWQKAVEELKAYKEDLPIWKLREGEYKIYET